MFAGSTFGKTMDIFERMMDVSTLRGDVIADNIANAETPDFKRSDISFEAELGRAIASEQRKQVSMSRTMPRHLEYDPEIDYRTVRPRRTLDYLTKAKNNGNNVDIEIEMEDQLKNQMRYQAMADMVRHEFSQINLVLR